MNTKKWIYYLLFLIFFHLFAIISNAEDQPILPPGKVWMEQVKELEITSNSIKHAYQIDVFWKTVKNATSYLLIDPMGEKHRIKSTNGSTQKITLKILVDPNGEDYRLHTSIYVFSLKNKRMSDRATVAYFSKGFASSQNESTLPIRFQTINEPISYCLDHNTSLNQQKRIKKIITHWNSTISFLQLTMQCKNPKIEIKIIDIPNLDGSTKPTISDPCDEQRTCNPICDPSFCYIQHVTMDLNPTIFQNESNFQKTILHELGHAFGLEHQPTDSNSIMGYDESVIELTAIDLDNLQWIYHENQIESLTNKSIQLNNKQKLRF